MHAAISCSIGSITGPAALPSVRNSNNRRRKARRGRAPSDKNLFKVPPHAASTASAASAEIGRATGAGGSTVVTPARGARSGGEKMPNDRFWIRKSPAPASQPNSVVHFVQGGQSARHGRCGSKRLVSLAP